MGGISPIGNDWGQVSANLREVNTGIRSMPGWDEFQGLNTRLGAPVEFETPANYPRRMRRSMGRVSLLSVRAAELALEDAGLSDDPLLKSGRLGIAHGSSGGSMESMDEVAQMLTRRSTDAVSANTYIKMMPHTTAAAVGMFFGITGRLLTSSTACTSGSLSIGMSYESIRYGLQDAMIAGGAEELSVPAAAVFDTLFATSTRNDAPHETPRPFDTDRDGLVVGEGSGALVLESLEHAEARGASVLAELVGFGTTSDGRHPTQPAEATMAEAMRLALRDANLEPDAIDYVNAHGTATDIGDIAESQATASVFGRPVATSSLKSYIGHTLGACGALEAWMTILMLKDGWAAPTANLRQVDERCGALDYIVDAPRQLSATYCMTNNFAFGGVNTSLIFRL